MGSKWLTGVFGLRRYLVTKDDTSLTHPDNIKKALKLCNTTLHNVSFHALIFTLSLGRK